MNRVGALVLICSKKRPKADSGARQQTWNCRGWSMKKLFECGHRGQGKFCHRCSNEERAKIAVQKAALTKQDEAAAVRARLAKAASEVEIDLSAASHLPAVLEKVLALIADLEAGVHPLTLGGKALTSRGGDFSIPVGLRYRLLVDRNSLKPILFVSHEEYNVLI